MHCFNKYEVRQGFSRPFSGDRLLYFSVPKVASSVQSFIQHGRKYQSTRSKILLDTSRCDRAVPCRIKKAFALVVLAVNSVGSWCCICYQLRKAFVSSQPPPNASSPSIPAQHAVCSPGWGGNSLVFVLGAVSCLVSVHSGLEVSAAPLAIS